MSRLRRSRILWRAITAASIAVLATLLVVPLVSLFVSASPGELIAGLDSPLVGRALRLSLLTTALTLLLVVAFGTPVAWFLANAQSRSARVFEGLVQLPVVIPPAVAGVALLLAFGRRGLLGSWLEQAGIELVFTTAAVVLAESFVSAPFFLQAAIAAFRALDPELVRVARSLGASPARIFIRIAVPLAMPGLVGGAAMCWARALGEFGATLMFAGNVPGVTQTLPLAIYTALERDLRAAQALSVLMVLIAFALLFGIRQLLAPGALLAAGREERR